jgi:hypothetical protein
LPEAEKLVATLVWFEGRTLDEAGAILELLPDEAAELHARAVDAVAASVTAVRGARPLGAWSRIDVDAECAASWRRYDRELAERYVRYFEAHADLRGPQRYSARDLEAALPPGWGDLADAVPAAEWHRHHLSGKSSQTLAVGLLGVAARLDSSLAWLWEALSPIPPARDQVPRISFEHKLDRAVLAEEPRQTAIDVLVDDPAVLICVESKWREDGIGTCSCGGDGGSPIEGRCAGRVERRRSYWNAAEDLFGLPERDPARPCPISLSYQAVRNAAAARALAGPERLAVFALIYDADNPYFAGRGEWPGWPRVLRSAVEVNTDPQQFRFAAISWQELMPILPLDDVTRAWAAEKHGLATRGDGQG